MSRFKPVFTQWEKCKINPHNQHEESKKANWPTTRAIQTSTARQLKQNSNNYCRGATKPSTFESLSQKNLRHVEKSAYRPQNLASYQKKRQSQDPTLVRIRLGLIKTGRIINSGAQFSNLEKIKEAVKRTSQNSERWTSCCPEKLKQPIRSKIMLGAAKRIIRPHYDVWEELWETSKPATSFSWRNKTVLQTVSTYKSSIIT